MQQKIEAILNEFYHPGLKRIDPGLDRVAALLDRLGNPQLLMPPVVHVAGTNGKGSTIAFLQAMLEGAGYSVHRYSSPHLVRFNERIVLAGKEISDEMLHEILLRVRREIKKQPVTFFEGTTAAAFLAFAEVAADADILLLETGMGGRLDATNVIAKPLLTVITPVSRDHAEFLGNGLSAIAEEKAGIMKAKIPCVTAEQEKEVLHVIKRKAEQVSAPLIYAKKKSRNIAKKIALSGKHQFTNADTALACADELGKLGFNIGSDHKKYGLVNACWSGRLQQIAPVRWLEKLPRQSEIWLDGGHNPAAGEVLADWLEQQQYCHHSKYMVVGMIKNKDYAGFLCPFRGTAISGAFAIAIDGEEMSISAESLAGKGRDCGLDMQVAANVDVVVEKIATNCGSKPVLLLICGSLYLAGAILRKI